MIVCTLLALSQPVSISLTLTSRIVPGLKPLAFAAAPSGSKFAATLEDNSVRVIDPNTGQTLQKLNGHVLPARAIAWSSTGTLATGDEKAKVFIWNLKAGAVAKTLINHQRPINKLSFNPTGTMIASTGDDDVVIFWSVASGKRICQLLGRGKNVYGGAFSPKSDLFATGVLSGSLETYVPGGTGAVARAKATYTNPLTSMTHGVFDLAWSSDGVHCVTAGNDNFAIVWDAKTMTRLAILRGHEDFVRKVAYSPNGRVIATSSNDRTVRLWDAYTFKQIAKLENQSSIGAPLAFSSDGKFLLTTNVEDSLAIHQITPPMGVGATLKPTKPKPGKRSG